MTVSAADALDWRSLDLDAGGRTLIEASAGTGKTWTIAVLYLRLLLERELMPRQLVVSTFTEAAAQELRERIRRRVEQAATWAAAPGAVDAGTRTDPAFAWLAARWRDDDGRRIAEGRRLQLALAELDGAPIGTLHALCQRILRDAPLESGSQFEPGELVAADDLIDECARDLIRVASAEPGAGKVPSPDALTKELKLLLRPGVVLGDADEARALAQRRDRAARWCRERLAARNQRTFDTLITDARDALHAHPTLARRLYEAWPVALVDEFQDTDAQQYGVLDALYRDADGCRGRLVMIGDPKQAIYGFRGGDVNAYLRASRDAERVALAVNHRSDPALVEALNQLYAAWGPALSARPGHDIAYHAVQSVPPARQYRERGAACDAPLVFHQRTDLGGCNTEALREAALEACAGQVVGLLADGTHTLDGAPLRPGHIAVLLPSHREIARLRALLLARGVPCVSAGRSTVFASDWARDLQLLLHAVLHPRSIPATRAALSTRLLGLDFAALQALRDDPVAAARETQRFERWRALWDQAGVLALVRDACEGAAARLLACEDGERAMTDLRHLGELLQQAEEDMHGADQLLAWLGRQREEAQSMDAEDRQLRMESDARRVRLTTLHASKGLEFPVVLLPLMWAHVAKADSLPLVPDGAGNRVVGFDDGAKEAAKQALQDECFRVLYVALTRARHACHVYTLPARRKGLGTGFKRSALDASLQALSATDAMPALPHVAWRAGWPPAGAARYAPASVEVERHARPLPPKPTLLERMHSFSSLSGGHESALQPRAAADEAADVGVPDPAPAEAAPIDDLFVAAELRGLDAIRGAEFGNALHQVFEERRIGEPLSAQHALVEAALGDHGVRLGALPRADAVARIARRVQGALEADLGGGLRLGALPARRQCAEMAFHYPLDGVCLPQLREACAAHGIVVPPGPAQSLHGLMHGRIDLVFEHGGRFHVLDYKGNRLGAHDREPDLAEYLPGALEGAMQRHHYDLQALLYTVAVERFLRQRLPGYARDRHLGEAIYLFVRAAGLAPGAGVWRRRFDGALLDAVDRILGATAPGVVATAAEEAFA